MESRISPLKGPKRGVDLKSTIQSTVCQLKLIDLGAITLWLAEVENQMFTLFKEGIFIAQKVSLFQEFNKIFSVVSSQIAHGYLASQRCPSEREKHQQCSVFVR